MATLRELYDTDFTTVLNTARPLQVNTPERLKELYARVHYDFEANAKYVSCYLAADTSTEEVCAALVDQVDELLTMGDGVEIQHGRPGEQPVSSTELRFAGRLFLYHEADLPEGGAGHVQEHAAVRGVAVRFRGPRFAAERTAIEKPLAFISHDSRDKNDIARPIAVGLSKLTCPVWFDEFSLKVGDRLRESIERGLRETRKCVLVLTPHFLSNERWTKAEFNSVFTREIIEAQDVVLPVWHNVSKRDVYDYSPSLADRVGVQWSLGEAEVVRRLRRAIIAA